MKKNIQFSVVFIGIILTVFIISGCSQISTPDDVENQGDEVQVDYEGKKVVFVDSYHRGYAWSDGIESGIHEVLDGTGVELKIVRLDTKQNPDVNFGEAAGSDAKSEIETFNPDVVIACDDNAQKYLVVPYFKGSSLPVVFCGVNWDASMYGYPTGNVTGMIEVELPYQLVELLKGYANGDRLGIISIDSETERKVVDTYNSLFFDGQLKPYWASTQEEFKEAFLTAQQEVDIIFIGNNAGSDTWDETEMTQFFLVNTNIPTGAIYDWMAPYSLLTLAKSPKEQGVWAAQAVLQILDGTKVSEIAITENKKGEVFVNLDIADKLSVVFPPSLLKNATMIGE